MAAAVDFVALNAPALGDRAVQALAGLDQRFHVDKGRAVGQLDGLVVALEADALGSIFEQRGVIARMG
jgi:hypothetical protein